MMAIQKVVMLVGSPRKEYSSSASIVNYLNMRMEEKKIISETYFAHNIARNKDKFEKFMDSLNSADYLIISFPLYVDSLPGPLINVLENIHQKKEFFNNPNTLKLIAICNCGLPEQIHNKNALNICQNFSIQCGFQWFGGLGIGGGSAINGNPLTSRGKFSKITTSLNLLVESIQKRESITQETYDTISQFSISPLLYLIFMNLGWFFQLKRKILGISGIFLLIFGIILSQWGLNISILWAQKLGSILISIGMNLAVTVLIVIIAMKQSFSKKKK